VLFRSRTSGATAGLAGALGIPLLEVLDRVLVVLVGVRALLEVLVGADPPQVGKTHRVGETVTKPLGHLVVDLVREVGQPLGSRLVSASFQPSILPSTALR